jgi:YjjG family noncanonical pyrimidine nucleotidase
MRYEGILFEVDTLLDLQAAMRKALTATCRRYLSQKTDLEAFTQFFKPMNAGLWDRYAEGGLTAFQLRLLRFEHVVARYHLSVASHEIAAFFEDVMAQNCSWLPKAFDAMQELSARFKIGLITNGFSSVQKPRFVNSGLSELCDAIVISEDVGLTKPSKEIFALALDQLGLHARHTIMVGDSLTTDYKGSLSTGLDFCYINKSGDAMPVGWPTPAYNLPSVWEFSQAFRR